MDCPSCPQAPLEEKEIAANLLADVCTKCAGIWLGTGELKQLVAAKPEFLRDVTRASKALMSTQLRCPGCSGRMNIIWLESTQLELKTCPACDGAWLENRQLRKLRGHPDPAPAPPPPPQEPSRSDSLISNFIPSVSWSVFGVGAVASYFIFIGVLMYAPPKLSHKLPRYDAARAEPARAEPARTEPAAVEAPVHRGPSETEVRAMVQAEIKGALTPARKPDIRSAVDDPSYASPAVDSRVALVVGVEDYADLPAAEFSTRDANAVRDHLLALGFPPRNVMILTGQDATKGRLSAALNSWLPKHADAQSTVFFYYSGHGAPDPASRQAYLVPVDGEADDLADTAIPLKQVYDKLAALKAKRVIVALDSCFSGLGGRSVLSKGVRPLIPHMSPESGSSRQITVLSASGPDQISGTLAHEGHGAFTYYLLEGLNGAAMDSSGAITVDSLYRYVKPRVQDAARLQKREQTPQMLSDADRGFVLRR